MAEPRPPTGFCNPTLAETMDEASMVDHVPSHLVNSLPMISRVVPSIGHPPISSLNVFSLISPRSQASGSPDLGTHVSVSDISGAEVVSQHGILDEGGGIENRDHNNETHSARYFRAGTEGVVLSSSHSPVSPMTRRIPAPSRRPFDPEAALVDVRLRRRFPIVSIKVLGTLHLFWSFLVFFVQFWTSLRLQTDYLWVRSLNTYGYLCALLSGLAGCCSIAVFLQISKVRLINLLSTSVASAVICCYLLTFYTAYFAELSLVNARCVEPFQRRETYQVPFGCMTFLALAEFFTSFFTIIATSTVINRARACWWRCDSCQVCQFEDDGEEAYIDHLAATSTTASVPPSTVIPFDAPPSYIPQPPPYKP